MSDLSPLVIKLGGRVLTDTAALTQLLQTIEHLNSLRPVVLVHGGGEQIQAQLSALNMPTEKVKGQRLTPLEHIPVVAGVLAGDINSQLCALAQQHQLNAVGLTLFAGHSTLCQVDEARGQVGVPVAHNPQLLLLLLAQGFTPVLSSIGVSETGQRLNCNADLAAAAIAQLLNADLILLTDVAGILDQQGQLIPLIDQHQAAAYIADGTVRDGMQVKLEAALQAAHASRRSIAVAGWQDATALMRLARNEAAGTCIRISSNSLA